jgi:hypothetical protein
MSVDREIILKSLANNLDRFLNKLSDIECIDLSNYLSYNFIKKQPTEIQKEFIEEFFTLDKWLSFYQKCKRIEMGHKISFHFEPEFWNEIRTHVLFHILFLYDKHLTKENKELRRQEQLIKDLDNAILNSEIDGIFDKYEGWLNVSEVLQKHKLINLDKY